MCVLCAHKVHVRVFDFGLRVCMYVCTYVCMHTRVFHAYLYTRVYMHVNVRLTCSMHWNGEKEGLDLSSTVFCLLQQGVYPDQGEPSMAGVNSKVPTMACSISH